MPYHTLHIHFISPDVPSKVDGTCKAFRLHQGSSAAGQQCSAIGQVEQACSISSNRSKDLNNHTALHNITCDTCDSQLQGQSGNRHFDRSTSAAQSHPLSHSAQQTDNLQGACEPDALLRAPSADTHCCKHLQLSFHTGCYHDVANDLQQTHGRPGLVFGANAGVPCCFCCMPLRVLLFVEVVYFEVFGQVEWELEQHLFVKYCCCPVCHLEAPHVYAECQCCHCDRAYAYLYAGRMQNPYKSLASCVKSSSSLHMQLWLWCFLS